MDYKEMPGGLEKYLKNEMNEEMDVVANTIATMLATSGFFYGLDRILAGIEGLANGNGVLDYAFPALSLVGGLGWAILCGGYIKKNLENANDLKNTYETKIEQKS